MCWCQVKQLAAVPVHSPEPQAAERIESLLLRIAELEAENGKLRSALHRDSDLGAVTDGRRQLFGAPSWLPMRDSRRKR